MLAGLALGPVSAEEPERTDSTQDEQRLERILALRRELEELLEDLSPEERKEFERRWRREQGREPAEPAPEVAAIPAPPVAVVESSSPAPPAPAEPLPVPEPVSPPETGPAPEPAAPRCGTLAVLDSNGDGAVSGSDRYWRYLSLWRDDGDGVIEQSELRSLFQHGIRRVSARLYSYTTAKGADRGVWVEDAIYFDLPGRRARATLTIDASRLARGDELWLEDAAGARPEGFQALRAGLTWVREDGMRSEVLCGG